MDTQTSASRHVVSLTARQPAFTSALGSITRVEKSDFPLLRHLSIRRLILSPRSIREPHWHANAHELGYCIRGGGLVTIVGNHGVRSTFLVGPGDMFFFPSGTMHNIENIGEIDAEFILAFSHEQPEDFGLSGAFDAMSESVLANTLGVKAHSSLNFGRIGEDHAIFSLSSSTEIETQARRPDPYKYRIEAGRAPTSSDAGSARMAKVATWAVLENIAMFSVRITDQGMREPHWHPQTSEMGYVVGGQGRMTVLDPDGSSNTFAIKPGDVYFIPQAYPHHIENTGEGTLHILIFFDQGSPGDIGYRAVTASYSREIIASELGIPERSLPTIPVDSHDPLIISGLNAVDRPSRFLSQF
jgi:oxalate decarboxylase